MFTRWPLMLLVVILLTACAGAPAAPAAPTAAPAAPTDVPVAELRTITLAMSFIPNIQFAPYYVAAANGYYADVGLDVQFDYNFENDVVARVAAWPSGDVAFATASGTSTLLARQQGLPVKTVMTLYQEFPIVFFGKAGVGINSAADLAGQTIGIPGRFGESLYGLLATLDAANLSEADLTVQEIGFTQAQAVLEDNVPVAMGYAMNEPVLLRQQGVDVEVLRVADIYNLAANGIIASEELINSDPELVRNFIAATLRGLQATLDDPDAAFALSLQFIPEANLGNVELQREVLLGSLPYWQNAVTDANGLGFTDAALWVASEQFMRDAGLLSAPVDITTAFTNDLLP